MSDSECASWLVPQDTALYNVVLLHGRCIPALLHKGQPHGLGRRLFARISLIAQVCLPFLNTFPIHLKCCPNTLGWPRFVRIPLKGRFHNNHSLHLGFIVSTLQRKRKPVPNCCTGKKFFRKETTNLLCRNKSYFCARVPSLQREFHSRRKSPK